MSTTAAPAARKDNLLGICHAIGEDFGFNPMFLRIPLAVGIIFSAKWTLIAYGAMGLAVLTSRLLTRRKRAPKIVILRDQVPVTVAEPTEAFALAA
jgi:phage shock protein PspC (stress-responsive transcriptional regulator)